jgi:hypothetical protein
MSITKDDIDSALLIIKNHGSCTKVRNKYLDCQQCIIYRAKHRENKDRIILCFPEETLRVAKDILILNKNL